MSGSQRKPPIANTKVDIARIIVGLIWLAGAMFNTLVTMRLAEPFVWLEASPIRLYRWFFRDVASAQPMVWTALLIVGEIALGILTLGRDGYARLGLVLGALFSAFLFTLLTPYTMAMGAYAAALGWLATKTYPTSPIERLWSFVKRQKQHSHQSGV